MQKQLQEKYDNLRKWLSAHEKLAVAFSGGGDSSLLLAVAASVIGNSRVLALTGISAAVPPGDLKEAKQTAARLKVTHKLLAVDNIKTINARQNPPLRCYYCKREIFTAFLHYAHERGFATLVEGSHREDEKDYRPGLKALQELAVSSPLKICGFAKAEIRVLAGHLGLPHPDRPSSACLVSRFPYGVEISERALAQVGKAEIFLRKLGFRLLRVRDDHNKAFIELDKEAVPRALALKEKIQKKLAALGFSAVTIETSGYKQGSMNRF